MSSTGNKATLIGAVLFSDLSMANYRVDYDSASLARPQGQVAILPRPQPLLHSVLEQAYQLHSEAIARFAEDAVSSGHAVGRGECWDLANAALKSLAGKFPDWFSQRCTHVTLPLLRVRHPKSPGKPFSLPWTPYLRG